MRTEDEIHPSGSPWRHGGVPTASESNYYHTIGLRLFEDDETAIAAAIDRVFLLVALELSLDADGETDAAVREQVQAIAATLIDPAARSRYDDRLRAQIAAADAPTPENSPLAPFGGEFQSPGRGVYPYGLVEARLAPA